MPVYYFLYQVKPTVNHPKRHDVKGAFVNRCILADSSEYGRHIAQIQFEQFCWHIQTLVENTGVTAAFYSVNREGLQHYEQALLDKEVYTFHTYETEEEC